MREYFVLKTKIGKRFLVVFLVVALLSPALIGWFAIEKTESVIEMETLAVLRAASDGAEAQLREFLEHFKAQLAYVSEHETIRQELQPTVLSQSNTVPSNSQSALSALLLAQQQKIPDAQEIFVLTLDGRIFASSVAGNVGRDYSSTDVFVEGKESIFAGDMLMDPESGQPTWIMTSPIKDATTHDLLGIIGFRIDPRKLSALTSGERILSEGADTQSFRIGDTGETYIVNRHGFMITESRYLPDSILKRKVETFPVRVAFERGEEITAEYLDYRGRKVSGSSFLLRNLHWVVITEIDFTQAFVPIQRLRQNIIVWTIVLVLLAVVLAWVSTSRLLRPLRLLRDSERALARRDEANAFVPEDGLPNDELGEFVRQRNARVRTVLDYQRQLEERTAKLHEMVSEIEHISYAIVHDMRAPLRAMQGFASILEDEQIEHTPEERKKYLRQINASAIRLDDLIRDVLTYNKTVLARTPLHPVEVTPLLNRILNSYPNLHSDKADIAIEGVLPPVIGNETLLTQCFSNLLDNAVKFAAPDIKPRIRIWAETVGTTDSEKSKTPLPVVRFWVEDNGIGIPKAAQPQLFRMFQRMTHDHHGTGVGLAIVRKVVERMGGRIGVESEPGKGSRFWVELPAAAFSTDKLET